MFTTIFSLLILLLLAFYITSHIKFIKIDKKLENDQNFWMFTYDFKDKKKASIFDIEPEEIVQKKRKKNKLIVLLYFVTCVIFIYLVLFISQVLKLILT